MTFDESTISDALHQATSELVTDADLTTRVRRGGARRLRLRQLGAAAVTTAVVGVVVPATLARAASNGSRQAVSVARPQASFQPGAVDACGEDSLPRSPSAYPRPQLRPCLIR